jgi:hypothetical protein
MADSGAGANRVEQVKQNERQGDRAGHSAEQLGEIDGMTK